ncbi:uncharacterized protein TNCV_70861 [Trichonephila clavipes]|nr:uncharacterized protein TNCV_70861 [Trichonephila clavipes]
MWLERAHEMLHGCHKGCCWRTHLKCLLSSLPEAFPDVGVAKDLGNNVNWKKSVAFVCSDGKVDRRSNPSLPPDPLLSIPPDGGGWRRPSTFSLRGVCIGPPPVGVEVTEPGYAEGTGHAHCNFDEPWEQGTASPATMNNSEIRKFINESTVIPRLLESGARQFSNLVDLYFNEKKYGKIGNVIEEFANLARRVDNGLNS